MSKDLINEAEINIEALVYFDQSFNHGRQVSVEEPNELLRLGYE